MNLWKPAVLTLALMAAYPGAVMAQSNDAVMKELKALKDRIADLEKKLAEKNMAPAAVVAPAPVDDKKWGMTPEQLQDFNRIAVKTEATEDNLAAWGYKGLTISGFIEPTYIYNMRQRRAGFQFLNDQADGYFYDTSYMGSASIDFTKETDSGSKWKLTLTPNRGVGAAIGGGIVQEASVSIPLTDPATRLIAGQIPDWSGYEYQQPTLNPFTSHNLLYDFTLPTGYTGVGMDVKIGKLALKAMIANVNKTIREASEKSTALVYRGDYAFGEYSGIGFAGLHGNAPNFTTESSSIAHLFEVDGYYTRGDWTLQGQVGAGMQRKGAITPDADGNPRDASWWGASGLVGYSVTPRLQALVRADYLRNSRNGGGAFGYSSADDRNGLGPDATIAVDDGTGTLLTCADDATLDGCSRGANRFALTTGLKFAYNASTTFKGELRYDMADRKVFLDIKDGSYHKTNMLFGASVVVAF